jgi:hypothetical protein
MIFSKIIVKTLFIKLILAFGFWLLSQIPVKTATSELTKKKRAVVSIFR